ncbi:Rossmann-like and DUF2520 domain-containing protein [Crocinitomix catalasitica]|uniref:Rossmann-like and DUF2520 domain-containing protein n=1 Tax=Crocinitomix catalasitica TaxID=184607 RepID=UPI000483CD85|nr:Rossmann-like and DUF2520 domain-containing protein [Crocinitomix catalasitica]
MIKINIIGSGNVAKAFALQLYKKVEIVSVYSRNYENALGLANKVKAFAYNDLEELNFDVDLNIIAVKDDAIEDIVKCLPNNISVVHTSGSVGIESLNKFDEFGILYPYQTFTSGRIIDMTNIPFFLEANTTSFKNELNDFCLKNFSAQIYEANSEKRKHIHLAAVITSNFTNHLLFEAEKILSEVNYPLDILKPLLLETIEKAISIGPKNAQTGPAKRNDVKVMSNQINSIESRELKIVYELMSKLIIDVKKD